MMFVNFQETMQYLESDQFIRPSDFESASADKNPLERFIHFLSFLDNPHKKFKSIVVSGTSGKGSTTIMIAAILTAAGYKTGQTISPHLEMATERFVINGKKISQEDFVAIINTMLAAIGKMKKSSFGIPSYFEILLAASFIYFAQEQVDIAIVEVGIEGKYDGTNALFPLGFVLTNISLDHTTILGDTVEKIGLEAVDRISYLPRNSFIVSAVMQESIQQIIKEKAKISQSKCIFLHKDFNYSSTKISKNGSIFQFANKEHTFSNFELSLIGTYQVENASLAIETVLKLSSYGFTISQRDIAKALRSISIPGRFEIISVNKQLFILDGAHNNAKMKSFLGEVSRFFPTEKKIFLVAFSTGHDAKNMLTQIATIADTIFITEFTSVTDLGKNRSIPVKVLQSYLNSQYLFEEKNLQQVIKKSYALAKQQQGLVLVTGSLYLIGQIREYLYSEHFLRQIE